MFVRRDHPEKSTDLVAVGWTFHVQAGERPEQRPDPRRELRARFWRTSTSGSAYSAVIRDGRSPVVQRASTAVRRHGRSTNDARPRRSECSARGRGRDQSPLVRAAPSHPERRRPRAAPPTTVQRCEPTCRGREMNDARHSHGRGVPALPWHHHVAPRQGEWALRSLPPEKVRPATPSLSATYWTLYATRRTRWRIGKRSMRCPPR